MNDAVDCADIDAAGDTEAETEDETLSDFATVRV